MRVWALALVVAGCDAGEAGAPPRPAPVPSVVADPGPKALLGTEPATLGPAFDGLALGQAIDQQAADRWLKQRGIEATAYVRDGHLASLQLAGSHLEIRWPRSTRSSDDEYWFAPALHQHATQLVTEQGTFVQFDREVPIEQWIDTTVRSIVRLDLVTTPMEDVKAAIHVRAHSNSVDGHESVWWVDSALAGAASATEIVVREYPANEHVRDAVQSHGVYVELEAAPAIYDAIEHRLTTLFGKPGRKANALAWHRPALTLTHTAVEPGVERIELSVER